MDLGHYNMQKEGLVRAGRKLRELGGCLRVCTDSFRNHDRKEQIMIKDNQKVFNRLLVVIDSVITAASLVLGYLIKFYILVKGPGPGVLPLRDYISLLVFIIPGYVVLYYRMGVYTPRRTVKRRFEVFARR